MLIEVDVTIRTRGRTVVRLEAAYYPHERRAEDELLASIRSSVQTYRAAVDADLPRRIGVTNGSLAAQPPAGDEAQA